MLDINRPITIFLRYPIFTENLIGGNIEPLFYSKEDRVTAPHTSQYNKIPTNPHAEELVQVLDMAREGHYPSRKLIEAFFENLQVILEPFGADVFDAAEKFVASMDSSTG